MGELLYILILVGAVVTLLLIGLVIYLGIKSLLASFKRAPHTVQESNPYFPPKAGLKKEEKGAYFPPDTTS